MNNQYQINTEKWNQLMSSLRPTNHEILFYWGKHYHENIDSLSPELRNDYCDVMAWNNDNKSGKYIILFTEKYDNDSMSITNASEIIATAFLEFAGLRYNECLFFESYPYYDRDGKIYFDKVEYDVAENYLVKSGKWEKTEILTKPKWCDRTDEFINLLNK
ncbi:hypothetical protein [Cyanobacterium aponinum]|uniref:hypothetical protein n=1 Tax=Cyanobacterium aponinum TaxID=379064 RepID=UPI000C12DD69|nr:hypothetical protein [Cyanobacterium aponinum]PHV63717.1 hypothetical protein CSQ80_03865 [Cyanobacterium aponinum IPPAS B-1201]